MADQIEQNENATKPAMVKKAGLFLLVVAAAIIGYLQFGHLLNLDSLAQRESQLRTFQADHPVLVYGVAFGIYVLATGLSIPGAAVLTLVYGWYFGFVRGLVLISFASTAGATVAFLLSRFLFRDAIQNRFGERLKSFNESLEKEGPFFLFTLRLIPAVPFFMINAVMGLTPIRTRTFWWVSQLGMLAGTAVYVYAGSSVPDLQTLADKGIAAVFTSSQLWQIGSAFVLLGLFPLIVRFTMKFIQRKRLQPT
ncbi:TVP38/TMEM64 family protein [Novipirellula caenicola]|uniref:TVP38/TMEM64 family membrane protein n=1 Tax=Novipirellula caenicola TaxID=1536901 RepID=A0ABP9VSS1_9BACT